MTRPSDSMDELKNPHGNSIRILNELIDINPVFSSLNIINKVLVEGNY